MDKETFYNSRKSVKIKASQIDLEFIFNLILNYVETKDIKNIEIEIDDEIKKILEKVRKKVDNIDEPVYGVNTGFGKLYNKQIEKKDLEKLQYNLIYSHSAGYGKPVNQFIVFLTILIRLNQLLQGYSGISVELIEQICKLIHEKKIPSIPCFTSVGASGDLIPLSHIFLEIIKNYNPKPKESLSFINGTSYSLANFIVGLFSLQEITKFSNFVLIISSKANNINLDHFSLKLKSTKKNNYFEKVLVDLNEIIENLEINKEKDSILQAPYSYRCYPQILESLYAILDLALIFAKSELSSSTDNPLIIEEKFISAGNFHGNTISTFSDHLKIHIFQLANLSFQRINHLLNPNFVITQAGLNSGFMISQYLASHVLTELKSLVYPLSIENFPVSLNQEDLVSYSENNSKNLIKSIYFCYIILLLEFLIVLQKIKLTSINLKWEKLENYMKMFFYNTDILNYLPIITDEDFKKFGSLAGLQNKIFSAHKVFQFLENII